MSFAPSSPATGRTAPARRPRPTSIRRGRPRPSPTCVRRTYGPGEPRGRGGAGGIRRLASHARARARRDPAPRRGPARAARDRRRARPDPRGRQDACRGDRRNATGDPDPPLLRRPDARARRRDLPERVGGDLPLSPGASRWAWLSVITPWNFPIAIPAWKIAPALAYGNTIVWKPAELVPLSAVHLLQALVDAGLPAGVLNLVLGKGSVVGDVLTTHRGRAGDHVHRLERGRPGAPAQGDRARQEGAARAGRQEPGGRALGRRSRSGRRPGGARCLPQRRSEVHGDQPRDRRVGRGKAVPRAAGASRRNLEAGRSAARRHPCRTAASRPTSCRR